MVLMTRGQTEEDWVGKQNTDDEEGKQRKPKTTVMGECSTTDFER